MSSMKLQSFETADQWLDALLEKWNETGGAALHERGVFHAALCGGSTPRPFYEKLARANWPWDATHLFIGDERWALPESPQSNYRMIYEALYPRRVQLERWKTEMSRPVDAARDYQKRIEKILGHPPRFDLMLLGIGEDGHTASLFPGSEALEETEKLTLSCGVPKLSMLRLTMTYPLICQAREIWFLAQGPSKKLWIDRMIAGNDRSFPAARVANKSGLVSIFYCK